MKTIAMMMLVMGFSLSASADKIKKGANDGKKGQCPGTEVLSCPYVNAPCKCVKLSAADTGG